MFALGRVVVGARFSASLSRRPTVFHQGSESCFSLFSIPTKWPLHVGTLASPVASSFVGADVTSDPASLIPLKKLLT
jgi:hypothetical protein